MAPPLAVLEQFLMMQFVRVREQESVAPMVILIAPPPMPLVSVPLARVTPLSVRFAPVAESWKKRVELLWVRVSRCGPGPVIVIAPPAGEIVCSAGKVIVCGVAKATESKTMVSAAPEALASAMAWFSEPAPEELAFVTVMVAALE